MSESFAVKKIIIGLIAGIISGFFASGGGLILVPAFLYFFGLDEKKARGTSILAILPMVIVSGWIYYQHATVDWNRGIKCAIGGMIGGLVGAKLLKKTPAIWLQIAFLIFLWYTSWKMLFT